MASNSLGENVERLFEVNEAIIHQVHVKYHIKEFFFALTEHEEKLRNGAKESGGVSSLEELSEYHAQNERSAIQTVLITRNLLNERERLREGILGFQGITDIQLYNDPQIEVYRENRGFNIDPSKHIREEAERWWLFKGFPKSYLTPVPSNGVETHQIESFVDLDAIVHLPIDRIRHNQITVVRTNEITSAINYFKQLKSTNDRTAHYQTECQTKNPYVVVSIWEPADFLKFIRNYEGEIKQREN